MAKKCPPRWKSSDIYSDESKIQPMGLAEGLARDLADDLAANREDAAKILVAKGVTDIEDAREVVELLAIKYCRRKELATTAPRFSTIKENIDHIGASLEELINYINNLDEYSIEYITESKLMILFDDKNNLDPAKYFELFEKANPHQLCNNMINSKQDSTWINKLSGLREYLVLLSKTMNNNLEYKDKGGNTGPYINRKGTPEFRLVIEGWKEYSLDNPIPSATRGSDFYNFINHIKRFTDGSNEISSDWVHPHILKYKKIIKIQNSIEKEIAKIRRQIKKDESNEDLQIKCCGLEIDLQDLEDFLEDEL